MDQHSPLSENLDLKHQIKIVVQLLVCDMQSQNLIDNILVIECLAHGGICEKCIYTFLILS